MLFLSDKTEEFGSSNVRTRIYSLNKKDLNNIYNCLDFTIQEFQTAVNDQEPSHFKLVLSNYVYELTHSPETYRCIKVFEKGREDTITIHYNTSFAKNDNEYSSVCETFETLKDSFNKSLNKVMNKYAPNYINRIKIREVLVDGPATIIFWDNGFKTVVKRDKQHDKKDNRREALIMAILKQTNIQYYKMAKLYSNPNKDKCTLAEYLLRKTYPWNEDYGRKWLDNVTAMIRKQTDAGIRHVRIVFRENKQPEVTVR